MKAPANFSLLQAGWLTSPHLIMMLLWLLAAASCLISGSSAAGAGWVNVNVKRSIDAKRQYLVNSVTVKAKAAGGAAAAAKSLPDYLLSFTEEEAKKLAVVNVTLDDAPLSVSRDAGKVAGA